MIGIVAYGAYIPRYRLNRKTISQAMGWLSPVAMLGDKAIANHDEDSLTMGFAAAQNCLKGVERASIDSLYFATTSASYRERESAAIMATALDLPPNIRSADFANSLKGGTAAILSACDSLKAASVRHALICTADCRLGRPGSAQEMLFGDGAASLLLGTSGVLASLEGAYSVTYDFPDYRRAEYDKFVRTTDDRFIREEGYAKFIPEAISGLFTRYKLGAKDFAKVAFPCLNDRVHAAIAKNLGFQPNQVQEPLLATVGETGTASALLLLVAMLEGAKAGDNILLASYGNGAEALYFKVNAAIEKVPNRGQLKQYLESKKELASYEKYLVFRGLMPTEAGLNGEVAPTQLPLTWREQKTILALHGSRCKRCGTPQYPPQRICVNPACGATDEMEVYPFADKQASLFSYTEDHTSACANPPLLLGMVEFTGGGRFLFDVTDCESGSLSLDMPVEMSLRRKYSDELRGVSGYFWKAMPIRVSQTG